jgi:dipeptidyl-peptidase 4
LNREQTQTRLISIDTNDKKIEIIDEFKSDIWINVTDVKVFFSDKRIIASEKDGFNHLYLFENDKITQLTKGEWVVFNAWGDEKNNLIYFSANKDSVLETHLYCFSLNDPNDIKR